MSWKLQWKNMRILIILVCGIILPVTAFATCELRDTVVIDTLPRRAMGNPYRFRPVQLIVPGVLIGAGALGLGNEWVRHTNTETKDELQEHPHSPLTIDDFSQYAPVAAAYGLRLCGVKGVHDYIDLSRSALSIGYSRRNSHRERSSLFHLYILPTTDFTINVTGILPGRSSNWRPIQTMKLKIRCIL